MDISPDILRRYFPGDITPGIYAIPEDDVNPTDDEFDNNYGVNEFDPFRSPEELGDTALGQKEDNVDDIQSQLSHMPNTLSSLTPEELQQYNKEIEPMKKIFLLQKLNSLSFILKNNFLLDSDLELLLKYGINFSYKTLHTLALNIINQLKNDSRVMNGNNNPTNLHVVQNNEVKDSEE